MANDVRCWSREWHQDGRISADVESRIRRERLDHLLGLTFGWVLAAVFATYCVVQLLGDHGPAQQAMALFAGASALFVMGWTTWLESTLPRAQGKNLGDFLAEKRHRLEREIAVESAWWPLAVVVVALAVWVPWKVVEDWAVFQHRTEMVVVGVSGLMFLLVGVAAHQVHRLRKDRQTLSTLLRLIAEVDGDWRTHYRR